MQPQQEDKVRKSSRCAWQIHYHIVFPVKYRKTLLDEEVTNIIKETAVGIEERYPIEMEALGTDKNHIHVLCTAIPKERREGLCKCLRVLLPEKSSEGGLTLNGNCGAENLGQMDITWAQWGSGPTGKWWNVMSNAKVAPKKTSNS